MGVPAAFKSQFGDAEVDWLIREDFADLIKSHPSINRIISFARREGLIGLVRRSWQLSAEPYTHVYDAHNNLRSWVVTSVFRARKLLSRLTKKPQPLILLRPKDRLRRWLFFTLRLQVLPRPFRGAESFHRPLQKWGLSSTVPAGPQFFTDVLLPAQVKSDLAKLSSPKIALAPSAAWAMKRWPVSHWRALIESLKDASFIILGGPNDHFLSELEIDPQRVLNLAGRLSLAESSALLKEVDLLVANDTGTLHVADQLERPTIALIGPTAFGYPSHATSHTAEIDLPCKPCSKDGRGKCRNSVYQRCLVDLSPHQVALQARALLASSRTRTK